MISCWRSCSCIPILDSRKKHRYGVGEGTFSPKRNLPRISTNTLPYIFLSSVQFSHSVVSNSLLPHESQHARPPYPSPTTGVHPNPCPLGQWCHPTISSSVIPSSSCPQSFPASGSFQMSVWVYVSSDYLGPILVESWSMGLNQWKAQWIIFI